LKICSAHQPAFLPWLGLIHKIMISDIFVVMDIAKFRKRAFMHRNKIEINGKANYFGLKLDEDSDYKTCDLLQLNKKNIHCLDEIYKKIEHTYTKSKFKNEILEFLQKTLININNYNFNKICFDQLKYICKKLSIQTEIILESNFLTKDEIKNLGASKRLLHHAQYTNSQVYITGINSADYLDVEIFKKNNIYHLVQKFNYDIFRNLQKCEDPLSIVHQIAHLGFDNLANLMNEAQTNKEKILTNLK
jgi:hypothetical protein|tara:strand:+ start:3214 stop:3954 length:741 start_codon:yes stop_codon:yes gene_type:complete